VDAEVGSELERALETLVPEWLRHEWPFVAPRLGV
jgi:hypothetical protein